jgi:hypothetical protein
MGRIFITCEDANILSTRHQYDDLNPKERFRYKVHHSHCPQCKTIDKRNKLFTSKLNCLGWKYLTAGQKSLIKAAVRKALSR